jgi:hypothetical protein
VTATLSVDHVPKLRERRYQLPSGDSRQHAQLRTSITSSSIGGGTGSPCARKLSR